MRCAIALMLLLLSGCALIEPTLQEGSEACFSGHLKKMKTVKWEVICHAERV